MDKEDKDRFLKYWADKMDSEMKRYSYFDRFIDPGILLNERRLRLLDQLLDKKIEQP